MSTATLGLPAALASYFTEQMVREPEALRAQREEADRLPERERGMRMSPEQGQLMAMLVRISGARRCLEIGTFVGYGSAWMAGALPEGGTIVTCEIEPRFAEIANRHWKKMGLADRIELRMGPALETIASLEPGSFDLAFIDADKERYPLYYERARRLVRPAGLVLVDNVFWSGDVADPSKHDAETVAIREVTQMIKADMTASSATVPISDGLTIVRMPG